MRLERESLLLQAWGEIRRKKMKTRVAVTSENLMETEPGCNEF